MIAGILHSGSGLGNQLHRYVMTRIIAEDNGYEWTMANPHLFKGDSFMPIDKGKVISGVPTLPHVFYEKKVVENGVDIRGYDPEVNFIQDGTLIDGEFQDERYFNHKLGEIDQWLTVEPIEIPDDLCVIGFRGGEYTLFSDLFLPKSYWEAAIAEKRAYEPNMRFQVHTDDVATAQTFFPDFECIHDIGINWRSMRYAKHAIIANSSFYILPRLLAHHRNKDSHTIAPRYWARHNTKTWALPQNFYKSFMYL